MNNANYISYYFSPIGWLRIKTDASHLIAITFEQDKGSSDEKQPAIMRDTIAQLVEYFSGKRKIFDLQLAPKGTEFQKSTWHYVENIEYGDTASYLDIAVKTGSSKNTRAVGLANGKNPIPIIIPCHRIVGSNGKLTGYAGGLERKQWLLRHELDHSDKQDRLF